MFSESVSSGTALCPNLFSGTKAIDKSLLCWGLKDSILFFLKIILKLFSDLNIFCLKCQ